MDKKFTTTHIHICTWIISKQGGKHDFPVETLDSKYGQHSMFYPYPVT